MTFLLIPPYLIFAFFVMRAVLKKQPTRKRKWQMGLLTVFLLYLPFGWDVILGRAVFYGLCATRGGVHVYQTVELGSEYFDKDGVPLFYNTQKNFDNIQVDNRYFGESVSDRNYLKFFNISKTKYMFLDKKIDRTVGEFTYFSYFGGWFVNYTGFQVKAEWCPSPRYLSNSLIDMSRNVFLMEKSE